MIISRAPLRISLGGGGTDLPSYYEKREGFLIAGGINKHIYVGANKQFYDNYSLKYSKIEIVKNIQDIKHNLIREALNLLNIKRGIEVTSLANVPSGTGLGSSGAFLVALLNTLHQYNGDKFVYKRAIAEEACKIELEILKEHEGKQDKYACTFGSIKGYKFHKNGKVSVIPLINEDSVKRELEEKLFLFYTGQKRDAPASSILKEQDIKCKENNSDMLEKLDEIKNIGLRSKVALENEEFDRFGCLLNDHWIVKKKYSPKSVNKQIIDWYEFGLKRGALGGKIVGAGGGGFMMFYHPGPVKRTWDFVSAMEEVGLKHMPFKFENNGVETISKEDM